jgi:hypothetical protein
VNRTLLDSGKFHKTKRKRETFQNMLSATKEPCTEKEIYGEILNPIFKV